MVDVVPAGKSWDEVRAAEIGVDLEARVPGCGLWGYRCVAVDELPTLEEMQENVLYFVREIPTP